MASQPQPVTYSLTRSAIFLVVTLNDGDAATREVQALLADVSSLVRATGFRRAEGALSCVVGIGALAWDRLYPGPRPRELAPLAAIEGVHTAPSTPGDLLFHIRGMEVDMCFELETNILDRLAGHVTIVDETQGFKFFDSRVRGYMSMDVTPQRMTARYQAVSDVRDPKASLSTLKSWTVESGRPGAVAA